MVTNALSGLRLDYGRAKGVAAATVPPRAWRQPTDEAKEWGEVSVPD